MYKRQPDKNIPEAHSGITCEVCHSIVEKPDITGNGKYIIGEFDDYPFSRSEGLLSKVNNMLIRVDPRAHKKNMLKPFHSQSEYCLTCHKVSLDTTINHSWHLAARPNDFPKLTDFELHESPIPSPGPARY